MNEKVYIRCSLQQMAQSEVLDMVPAETLQRIRAVDSHPEFRVFSVGHEGEANANVLGVGMKVLKYAKDIIVQMFNKIKLGLPTFNRHDPNTNSHINREVVGEVVGKTVKTISGVLHTLTAVYIKPEHRGAEMDIASIEGNFEAEEHSDGSMGVVRLSNITGIALSNHSLDTPGMPGATLQAALQMFTQKGRFQQMDITKEQVKEAILKLGIKVNELYSDDDIVSSEPAKKSKQNEYEHAKRLEKRLGEAREENSKLQGENVKLQDSNKQLQVKANVGTTKEILKTVSTERKLDDKFVKFIEKNVGSFKSEKEGDEFKTELEKFVDTQAKEYKEMGELYGFETKITTDAKGGDDDDSDDDGKGKGTGTPSSDGKGGKKDEEVKGDKYTDPEKNDFIPEA